MLGEEMARRGVGGCCRREEVVRVAVAFRRTRLSTRKAPPGWLGNHAHVITPRTCPSTSYPECICLKPTLRPLQPTTSPHLYKSPQKTAP
jgi:hypothetical protein